MKAGGGRTKRGDYPKKYAYEKIKPLAERTLTIMSTWFASAAGAALDVAGREDGALVGDLTNGWTRPFRPAGVPSCVDGHGNGDVRGTTRMKLKPTAETNDVLQAGGGLNFGGTLALTNLGGAVGANDSFKLFNAGGYSGALGNVSPVIPVVNLAWDINTLALMAHSGLSRG